MKLFYIVSTIVTLTTKAFTGAAFVPSSPLYQRQSVPFKSTTWLFEKQDTRADNSIWNPPLRKIMAATASLGIVETAYLTVNKLNGYGTLCGIDGSCSNVLNGPYAIVPGTNIPLSALGCGAYACAAILAIAPLVVNNNNNNNNNDIFNRIALLCVSTSMATFSVFLLSLLFGVLQESCPFCVTSALFSWTLGVCAWWGGCLPPQRSLVGLQSSMASFVATSVVAVTLFANVDGSSAISSTRTMSSLTTSFQEPQSPPTITKGSSLRALVLAQDLERYDARMFGAFWCSHCFDQKMALGKEAFSKVQYIECAKDGVNSQTAFCKEKDVPGYPTWEIGGKLFPGEQELEELEVIIQNMKNEQN